MVPKNIVLSKLLNKRGEGGRSTSLKVENEEAEAVGPWAPWPRLPGPGLRPVAAWEERAPQDRHTWHAVPGLQPHLGGLGGADVWAAAPLGIP